MKKGFNFVLIVLFIFSNLSSGEISFVGEGYIPEPNEEITIQIQTDVPLFAMGLGMQITGDANITGGMCEADCNNYGWDNGWNSDPYIDDANGWVYLSGVSWPSEANGIVGYIKFRYNSGQAIISIFSSEAFDANCQPVGFSQETLIFGESDANDYSEQSGLFSEDAIVDGGESMMDFLSSYDETITGVHKYNTPVSYSNQTILAADNAYLVYDGNFSLVNCVMDVNGSIEFNSDVILTNSQIIVKGAIKCKPGIQITETGASSIMATGDSVQSGKITIEGKLDNPIAIISDEVSTDSEFIIIDANSSSNSSLKCIDFYGGWTNIQIYNKRLNNPISNCCFFGAEYAIWQDGIQELTTVSFSLFCQNVISIYASIDGTSRTITYPLIDNVVIDGVPSETWGIILAGAQSTSYFDYFEITNSIITNCYCGWYFDVDSVYPPNMLNLAYYGNDYDDNYGHPSFVRNPMYLTQSPFEEPENFGDWPYFINPESPVADVNLGYNIWQDAPEQMLSSIYSDSTPRTNKGLGFGLALSSDYVSHVPSLITGDFDESGLVNNLDLCVLGKDWGSIYGGSYPIYYPDANGYSIADFDKGGVVNIFDLAVFAANWLSKDSIGLTIDSNETLLTAICQQIPGLSVKYYVFFLDGKFIGLRDPNESSTITIEKIKHPQGVHYLKAVAVTTNGNQFYTENEEVLFNPPLSNLNFDESFNPSKKFTILGEVDAGYTATISVQNLDNQILWSDAYTSDFITKLDSSVFSSEIEFEVTYSYDEDISEMLEGGSMMMSSSSSSSGSSSVVGLDGPPDYRTTGLILCMMEDGMKDGSDWTNTGTCMFARKMMLDAGVWPMTLRGYGGYNRVRRGIINQVFRKYPNIKYGHIYAHGNYETDGAGILGIDVRRTRLLFNDGEWVAFNSRKWKDKGQAVPAGYEYLSNAYENAHYLNQIPFTPGQLKILVIESCYALRNIVSIDGDGLCQYHPGQYEWEINNHRNYSYDYGYPYSDICAGLNMTGNQFALGGGEVIIKGGLYPYYSRLFNHFWEALAEGDTTLNAWYDAYNNSGITVEVQYKHRWRGYGTDVTLNAN